MLQLSAKLHRTWYLSGDAVRAEVSLCCLPNQSDGKDSALVTSFRCVDNYFTNVDPDTPSVAHVKSLTAQVVGVCVVDTRRIQYKFGDEKLEKTKCLEFIGKNLSNDYHIYKLFASNTFPLAGDLSLHERESKALVVTFNLPEYLPPSFRGQCLQFYYGFNMHGVSCTRRGPHTPLRLYLPIKVLSSEAVITTLFLSPCFPVEKFDFGENVHLLKPVPSPALTAPLQDYIVPSENEEFSTRTIRRKVSCSLAMILTKERTPLEVPLKLREELVLTVSVWSTTVSIGDSLKGVFLLQQSSQFLPVKILAVVEFLECCNIEHLKKGITCYLLPGNEVKLAIAQTTVVGEHEWTMINCSSVPFFVPFTNLNCYASMKTDVVTTCWQLRLRFLWSRSSMLWDCRANQRDELAIEEETELVIPLTVVPPPPCPKEPHTGLTLSTVCQALDKHS